jgi:ATP-dependent RNA helicase DDX47/RRP3
LGAFIGLKTAVLVGGLNAMDQAIALTNKPHIIVGTPGRVADHVENTKGFSLQNIQFLVLDEADRLLNMDFEKEITKIISTAPRERTTLLFSATMTT